MQLQDLGYDSWFQEHASTRDGFSIARVTAVHRERYLVRNERAEILAEPTGKLVYAMESNIDLPCVGDWVLVQYHNDDTLAIVHDVLPRRSFLRRKSPGKNIDYQMIAANIDVAFIVQSCDFDFNLRRLERYLVIANEGNIEPVIVLSKSDLVSETELQERIEAIRNAHISKTVIPFSNQSGAGMQDIHNAMLKGKTYCLLGSSGVGKTTLVNQLIGREAYATAAVREKDGKGRHTTSTRQLIVLDNGALLVDTPGMRELGVMGADAGIEENFGDIQAITEQCKFGDCTHTSEPGCAILAALESGELDEDRYRSYQKLQRESAYLQSSYLERRQKERKTGKLYKAIKERIKKTKR
ncbi:MAG: ribosome small subunit-dependent GTPase A [Ignavibacteriae bacterium]|nr:ribosome small subunit-dependent GTPase A [Ignavibacteriota bacterium]